MHAISTAIQRGNAICIRDADNATVRYDRVRKTGMMRKVMVGADVVDEHGVVPLDTGTKKKKTSAAKVQTMPLRGAMQEAVAVKSSGVRPRLKRANALQLRRRSLQGGRQTATASVVLPMLPRRPVSATGGRAVKETAVPSERTVRCRKKTISGQQQQQSSNNSRIENLTGIAGPVSARGRAGKVTVRSHLERATGMARMAVDNIGGGLSLGIGFIN